jgi:hypothetical protein
MYLPQLYYAMAGVAGWASRIPVAFSACHDTVEQEMITIEYHNVEDVYVVARQLCDRLSEGGDVHAAKELDEIMTSFWTTASEALGEIKLGLLHVHPRVESTLGSGAANLLDSAVNGATKLWNGCDQRPK